MFIRLPVLSGPTGLRRVSTVAAAADKVGTLLKQMGHTVAVAESSAGGRISAALLEVPGEHTHNFSHSQGRAGSIFEIYFVVRSIEIL